MFQNNFGSKGWTPERIGSLKGKTYLITGATSGTGFEASKILASKGAKVVMLNRNPKKSEDCVAAIKQELGNHVDVSFIRMDLGEQASVRKAAEEVLETVTRIDALICNAAIAQVPERKLTVDGFESQPVSEELIDQATHVFAMTASHLQALVSLFPEHEDKFYLACEFVEIPGRGISCDVPDPYGMGRRAYEEVAKTLDQCHY